MKSEIQVNDDVIELELSNRKRFPITLGVRAKIDGDNPYNNYVTYCTVEQLKTIGLTLIAFTKLVKIAMEGKNDSTRTRNTKKKHNASV